MNTVFAVFTLVVLLVALAFATVFIQQQFGNPVGVTAFTVLSRGQDSGVAAAQTRLARTQEEVDALWQMLSGMVVTIGKEEPPQIDPQNETVLAVFMGQKNTGGHRVEITQVTLDRAGNATVHVVRTAPGDNCMTTQALSSPYDIVKLERAIPQDAQAYFEFEDQKQDC